MSRPSFHHLDTEEEEEENTGMENQTDGQKRAAEARALFVEPGETWLTNDKIRPYYNDESLEDVKEKLRDSYPGQDLRFDFVHIVDGFGEVRTTDELNIFLNEDRGQINFAVYGKPKLK